MKYRNYAFPSLLAVLLLLPWLVGLSGFSAKLPLPGADLWAYPGILKASLQTLAVGLIATLLSTVLASLILFAEQRKPSKLWALTFTAPHLAFAVAFLWLFTPFGWFDRLLPGHWAWFEQQSLLTLTLILIIKETPFLVVLGRQQLLQLPYQQWLMQGRSLASSHWHSWWLLVFPPWLRSMRLLLIAVAVYSVGVVDVATLAGPLNPPLLGPLLVTWQQQFDPLSNVLAAQGLWLLIALTLITVGWLYLQEALLWALAKWRLGRVRSSRVKWRLAGVVRLVAGIRWVLFIASMASGLALVALSLGKGWFYPALVPQEWSWQAALATLERLVPQLLTTLGLALLTALVVSIVLITCREWQRATGREYPDLVFIAALLVPQTALVLAWLQTDWINLVALSADSAWWLTFYAHAWFAFAYAYLSYAPAERSVTQAHLTTGRSLGYGYWQSWWYFKRPDLIAAIGYAFLVSFLVSIAQYVPTLLLGQGYLSTLTTELVVLSSGAELQAPAVAALLLWLLALGAILLFGNLAVALFYRRFKQRQKT
ncbi:hypothetical protein [Pseudidiomarina sp.]|uniref:hypothetical protein n=1 Tax=Pseudidiomarina sp. TaxID=2081707 RepID=UPI003A973854